MSKSPTLTKVNEFRADVEVKDRGSSAGLQTEQRPGKSRMLDSPTKEKEC